MINSIYALPLKSILAMIVVGLLLWSWLWTKLNNRIWQTVNLCLLVFSLASVLHLTILDRSAGNYEVLLCPFSLFKRAQEQPEIYREMLMNVFLFFPLGLALSNVLPQKWTLWGRIALTTLFGCLLSIGVEFVQYRFSLGMAETDDVLCNTLGAFLGTCSMLIAYGVERLQKRIK